MSQANDLIENPEFTLLTDPHKLIELASRWQDSSFLAIDTEFIRINTFFAEPGLIQIADEQAVYLIDPVAISDLSVLVPVLENPDVVKIMHSMNEDVGLLFHSVGAKITNVFDTQVAASFLGIGPSLGYQNLVAEVLDIELDKGETRSNWLQRPLTQSQLHYAALDVIYLLKLYHKLAPKLKTSGYLDAMFQETGELIQQVFSAWEEPELAYLKLRGGWELSEDQQKLLQALVMWRDETALNENIPKPWVFNDATLIEIARIAPDSPACLKRIRGIQGKSFRQFSGPVTQIVASFQANNSPNFMLIEGPVRAEELKKYKQLKAIVSDVSKSTGIPAQLLGSRKMLESLVIHCFRHDQATFTKEYQGWRSGLLASRFKQVLLANV